MPLPSVTSDLIFWFDARDISGLSDGATTSTWADSTGNGHTATVTTGSATYHTAQYNGGAALTLSSCRLTISGMSGVTATDAHTSFIIFKLATGGGAQFLITQQGLGCYQVKFVESAGGSSRLQALHEDYVSSGTETGTAAPDTAWHASVQQQTANVSTAFWLDGAADTRIAGPGLSNLGPPDALGGGSPSGGNYFAGQVQAIGYWNRVLNSTEVAALFAGSTPTPSIRQPMIFVVT